MEITVKDSEVREEAMRRVMWTVGNTKNPVTNYIAALLSAVVLPLPGLPVNQQP